MGNDSDDHQDHQHKLNNHQEHDHHQHNQDHQYNQDHDQDHHHHNHHNHHNQNQDRLNNHHEYFHQQQQQREEQQRLFAAVMHQKHNDTQRTVKCCLMSTTCICITLALVIFFCLFFLLYKPLKQKQNENNDVVLHQCQVIQSWEQSWNVIVNSTVLHLEPLKNGVFSFIDSIECSNTNTICVNQTLFLYSPGAHISCWENPMRHRWSITNSATNEPYQQEIDTVETAMAVSITLFGLCIVLMVVCLIHITHHPT